MIKNIIISDYSNELIDQVSYYLSCGFNAREISEIVNKHICSVKEIKHDLKVYYKKALEEKYKEVRDNGK